MIWFIGKPCVFAYGFFSFDIRVLCCSVSNNCLSTTIIQAKFRNNLFLCLSLVLACKRIHGFHCDVHNSIVLAIPRIDVGLCKPSSW